MTPLPRGTCIRCRKSVALRTNDVAREHWIDTLQGKKGCPGSSMRPLEALKAKPSRVTDSERAMADRGGAW
jgi:hypothetical protein